VFISKGSGGEILTLEVDEFDEFANFLGLEGEVGGVISPEDVRHAAVGLSPDSSAALLVWEDRWAATFVEALGESGAVLVEGGRIPRQLMEEVLTGMAA
jgi:Family of unknown function (DUF6325)